MGNGGGAVGIRALPGTERPIERGGTGTPRSPSGGGSCPGPRPSPKRADSFAAGRTLRCMGATGGGCTLPAEHRRSLDRCPASETMIGFLPGDGVTNPQQRDLQSLFLFYLPHSGDRAIGRSSLGLRSIPCTAGAWAPTVLHLFFCVQFGLHHRCRYRH